VKRLAFLVAALALASCAPSQGKPAPKDPGFATLTFTTGASFDVIQFEAGEQDALNPHVLLTGPKIEVNAPDVCAVLKAGAVLCTLPTVPAGQGYTFNVRGTTNSEADFGREGRSETFTLKASRP
jgi:hypothetical protein